MTLAQNLDIYKAADALLVLSLKVQAQVPRSYRLAIGQRLSNECAEILLAVARANVARGERREQHIEKLLEHVEATTVLMRAAHTVKAIPRGVWSESIELTDSVGKQANGWLKASRRTNSTGHAAA